MASEAANKGSCARCRTGLAIIPIKVTLRGGSKSIITYAFLDNGSNSSFCTESLALQLGWKGQRTEISLSTLEKKKSTINSFIIHDLRVSDLDENENICLPTLYTRPEIPVSSDDIPTQDDIDRWPHLQGVFIPNVQAEVGLHIAADVPEALDPLEIKHTDRQLHQTVEEFYNHEYSESIADDKTEMSQEEMRFRQNAKETVRLENGNYQISLPFKDHDILVPNNKTQVLQPATSLKKRLQRDQRFGKTTEQSLQGRHADQRICMEQKTQEYGKAWYIPHHGVYHPRKPGKIRVVFYCSAKFNGVSLNSMQ
ncbi:uncharacterized protein [Montipora capricornis]|uniref:uncharacterized protein n=1 Tax=Montipora capricornis TaxID=246305 RepID=UPI0035F16242